MFDDLHNSISRFTHNIVEHLMELQAEESYSNEHSNLFINIFIPVKKGINLPIKNKENIYHGKVKFYSTSTKAYNKTNLKSIYYNNLYNNNNPLMFKCNNINSRHLYKINHLNKLFYTTEVSRAVRYFTCIVHGNDVRFYSTSLPFRNRWFHTSANINSKIVKHKIKKGRFSTILIPYPVYD